MAHHSSAPTERRQVTYSGHVQGVGFRFTAKQIAENHWVTGYVRNLPDGRVELAAEGEPAELDQFLGAVAHRLGEHIRRTQVEVRPATGEFTAFEIRH